MNQKFNQKKNKTYWIKKRKIQLKLALIIKVSKDMVKMAIYLMELIEKKKWEGNQLLPRMKMKKN